MEPAASPEAAGVLEGARDVGAELRRPAPRPQRSVAQPRDIAFEIAPFSEADIPRLSAAEEAAIRAVDVTFSLAVVLLLWPVMLAVGLLIRLDSPGPALFVQQRVGKDGRPFRFVKFRTFYADARTRFPELYAYAYSRDEMRTLRFKLDDDPRATRVGRWLRRTSLDELPNFMNVLTGECSLVGPRPEIPEMVRYYDSWQLLKWKVKPGVTGLAQIEGRGHLTFQETVYWDIRCVAERGLRSHIRILHRTITAVLKGIGAF